MLWLLSRRDYSAQMLRTKLKQKEYPPEEVEEALLFMQEHKFQDDGRFARISAENKSSKMGDRGIRQALGQKGIDAEVISLQLENLAPESERVIHAVRKFEGKELTQKSKQQIFRFLAYRGFSSSAIKTAMQHLIKMAPVNNEDSCDEDFTEDYA